MNCFLLDSHEYLFLKGPKNLHSQLFECFLVCIFSYEDPEPRKRKNKGREGTPPVVITYLLTSVDFLTYLLE